MRTYATALFVATLAVTSADAAEVTPAAQPVDDCATHAVPMAVIKAAEEKGRMPVRGMDHFVAIYGRSPASADESTAREQAAVVARVEGSRG
jgi:hypothetical protein